MSNGILRTIRFSETKQWNVEYFFATQIVSRYPISCIGEHTIHITKKTKVCEEPDREYKILGISNEVGMFDAYSEFGRNINQPYIFVANGYLAYNPYRINVGSIGLKTEKQKNEYISPAYVVFQCKKTILPEFLFLILKSSVFNSLIKENTTGSVRQTLSYDKLAQIRIPVPSLPEQQDIINKFYATSNLAKDYDQKANKLDESINTTLFSLLGISSPAPYVAVEGKLSFIKFAHCDKWSVDYLLNKHSCDFIETSKWPIVQAKHFITGCQYGLSEKASRDSSGVPILRMNNIQNSSIDTTDLKFLPAHTKALSKYILKKGDLLFNRTNSKELVGKTAVYQLDKDHVFASYLIRVNINPDIANVSYVNYLFASKIIRAQINLLSRQILGQANINVDELNSLRFPLPPLHEQKKIVAVIDQIKQSACKYRNEADKYRKAAHKQFEEAVFGEA